MRSAFSRIMGLSGPQRTALAEQFDKAARLTMAEPVAVVGMGCRFPGNVVGPDSYWELLVNGRDVVTEVPADRWDANAFYDPDPAAPGRMASKWGGFLSDVTGFDAEFFGIAPREAEAMDPQQRVLLEVSWEALEHAGIPPDSLGGSRTAVMIGVYYNEYQSMCVANDANISAYAATGNAHSVAVGRIAYLLGLQGPAVAVDTACSSSLVAVHLACQSLRLRESDLALAGGVNLILRPETQIALSSWGMFSATGRCKCFDVGADGFVRGEGCGVVALKRLADAVRDGDRVFAVVRGSAVNQDGRSNGITAPNALSQREVISEALRAADVSAESVNYVETHGTGTALGDPIEFDGLAATYGRGDGSCAMGAVKSNLGHLEAAAGIAGLIKATLALQHAEIPANLHFSRFNPAIDASATRLFVPTSNTPWPSCGSPRRAAVSSFGFGGTNAHVVLEQGPDAAPVSAEVADPAVTTLVVSGKSSQRVASLAAVLADWMEHGGADIALPDVAHAINHHRPQHGKFATVAAHDRGQAMAGLQALADGRPALGVVGVHEGRCGHGRVFVYSGQGSQWAGMGRQLLGDEPAFAAAVDELEPVFVAQTGFSLRRALGASEPVVGIARIQPVLVGMQLALTTLWQSYGVQPDAVVGHSMGEVTAAVVAGAMSVADGLRVITTRSRLMAQLSGRGAMALLELGPSAAEGLIAQHPDLTIAVYASPRQSVIAGPPEQVDALISVVARQDRLARRIDVDVASHHPIIDPVLPQLRASLADLRPASPTVPLITTTYQDCSASNVFNGAYWCDNLRNPVRFSQAVCTAAENHTTFIEVSPHPLLTHAISETVGERHHHAIATLQRDANDTLTFHSNLNAAHTTHPPRTPHPPELHPAVPTTPWHHAHHWISTGAQRDSSVHPLLGTGVTDPSNGRRIWENVLGSDDLWFGDHLVGDVCVMPAAALAEIALAAVTETFGGPVDRWTIRELRLDRLIHLADQTTIVTTLTGDESLSQVKIGSRRGTSKWVEHATATLERAGARPELPFALDDPDAAAVDANELYQHLRTAGQQHGPAFRGITGLTVSRCGIARADVRLPSPAKLGSRHLLSHPVMVDIALQTLGATKVATDLAGEVTTDPVYMLPTRMAGIHVHGHITDGVRAFGSLAASGSADHFIGQVFLTDADGQVLLAIDEIETVVLRTRESAITSRMFMLECEPCALEAAPYAVDAVLLIGDGADSDPLLGIVHTSLLKRTAHCQLVPTADDHALDAVLARPDINWDAIVLVCPPRAADESLPDDAHLELAQARTLLIARVVNKVVRMGARYTPRLFILTRGAQQLDESDHVTLAQTQLRGIARVLTFEHPELRTTTIDIDADGTVSGAAAVDEVLAAAEHDDVALRQGRRYVNRLVRVPRTPAGDRIAAPSAGLLVKPDGGYIVVGGMGGVGFATARWLARQGAGMVVLNGRSAPDTETLAAIAELNAGGSRVETVIGDIASPDTAARLVDTVERAGFRLCGVVHSAMVLADEIVLNMSLARVASVFQPKVIGGWRLHRATADRELDWWMAFSSAASLLGSPGQGAYAAANSWLDGLVAYRRSHGLPGVGINWGPWVEVGRARSFADLGFSMITVEDGLSAMREVLAADRPRTGVFSLDARQWFQSFPAAARSSLFGRLGDVTVVERRSDGNLRAELDALDASGRHAHLAAVVADEIRAVLRSTAPIDQDEAVASLGLDSLMGLELRNRLESRLGTALPVTLVWAYPTITELAGAMCERLGYGEPTDAPTIDHSLSEVEMRLLSEVAAASELEVAMGADEP
jgi:acyl transferase domain-containing protein/acyl carrier protein